MPSELTPSMRAALRWPPRTSASEWVHGRVVLGDDAAEPGPIDVHRTPYTREWQDGISDIWVRQITTVASTQVGKTQSGLNMLAYVMSQDPGPITWVMPGLDDAKEFGEERVTPMIERSPILRDELTGERFDTKKRRVRLRRCRILFRSANRPKELAGYPARYLFLDEAGKLSAWTQKEAGPFNLARERTHTFWNHKIVLTSTPVLPDGLISVEFERGDRRRYWVPCPHCGQHQVLRWQQVQWDREQIDTDAKMRAAKRAWYECEHCQQHIEDRQKQPMLAAGIWCPEAVELKDWIGGLRERDRAPHRSYHIWAGYSPWITWWKIVAEWLRCKDRPEDLQNFVNSWLAEPWVQKVEEPKREMLDDCIGGYRRPQIPEGVLVITAGVDVQKRFLAYTVRGWGLDMESWLLDHARVATFDELEAALLARPWGNGLSLLRVFVDSQYRQNDVIEFARKYPALVKILQGAELDDPRPFSMTKIDRHPRTGAALGMILWRVNVGMFKDQLSTAMQVGGQDGEPNAFHVYEDVDEQYCNEMLGEHKVLVRKGRAWRERWIPRHGRRQNHFWDTEVYNRAIAQLERLHTLRQVMERSARPRRAENRRPRRGGETGFGGQAL
ncbi:MAG: phage terminase large subunit family protein [Planctomycetes bacterium]|nr:phage terminase large subunit family protein [Planctomycetota bacterium]